MLFSHRRFPWPNFDLETVRCFASFYQKMVSASSIKISKKITYAIFTPQQCLFLSSKKFQNHFLTSLLWPNFNLNTFWCFASFSQIMVSTSSFKKFKKLKIVFSKYSEHSFWISRLLQNHFLKRFSWLTLTLNSFEASVLPSQEIV